MRLDGERCPRQGKEGTTRIERVKKCSWDREESTSVDVLHEVRVFVFLTCFDPCYILMPKTTSGIW